MPVFITSQYTMTVKHRKVNGVKKTTSIIYENGKEIYRDDHSVPGKNEVFAANFINAMRTANTRTILNQIETNNRA